MDFSLGDYSLFSSSVKKPERCEVRDTLPCTVAEHTAFPPKKKGYDNYFVIFFFKF